MIIKANNNIIIKVNAKNRSKSQTKSEITIKPRTEVKKEVKREKFEVLKKVSTINIIELKKLTTTKHLKERLSRLETVSHLMSDGDKTYNSFLVNTGHHDGNEIHNITKSGLDIIINERKYNEGKPCLVTVLIARPHQVTRLYKGAGMQTPSHLLVKCAIHQQKGLNHI